MSAAATAASVAATVPAGANVSHNAQNPVLALKEADLKMMLAAKVRTLASALQSQCGQVAVCGGEDGAGEMWAVSDCCLGCIARRVVGGQVHLGTKNADPQAARYIWRRRPDGVHIINLGKTWQKILLAARIIAAIENPEDVVVVSSRQFGQRSVFKFAQHTGAQYVGGRYTPGTFTNQIQKKFLEPRLLIVTDPLTDHQVRPLARSPN